MFLNRDNNAPPWFAPTPYRYVLPGLQHTSVIEKIFGIASIVALPSSIFDKST